MWGAEPVIGASLLLLLGAVTTVAIEHLWAKKRTVAVEESASEVPFRTLAEAIPAITWTARPDGSVDFLSERLSAYSGISAEKATDWGWKDALHPDDLEICMTKWGHCIRTGDPYEIEYRLRSSEGAYRWFLVRGNPVRDEQGQTIKWIGTCTDIEDQNHHLQTLEDQIKERTLE